MSTLANAMEVLKLIVRLQHDVTVTDVAEKLCWPKSSVSRTLSKMAEHGFLERDPATRAYRPGKVVMEASYYFRTSRSTISLLEDELTLLVKDTGYTSYISLLDNTDTIVVQMRVGSTDMLQAYTPIGTRSPAYASSMGRAILARLPDPKVMEIFDLHAGVEYGCAPRTGEDLLERLNTTRKQGWSLSFGEFVKNVAGISSAVADPDSGKIYGLGIALPSQDLTDDFIDSFSKRVRKAAMTVGQQIGDIYWLNFTAR